MRILIVLAVALGLFFHSPSATAQSATRCVAGQITGGFDPDVVVLRGTALELHYGPEAFGLVYDVSGVARDVALAPGRGPAGADAFAWVGDGGLALGSYTPFGSPPITITSLAGGAWLSATRVLVARDDTTVFVGVSGSGSEILVFDEGTGVTATYALPSFIHDVVLYDHDSDGDDDVFVACETGVRVLARDGSTLFDMPAGLTDAFAARVAQNDYERVAFAATPSGTSQQLLYVLDQDGMEPPASVGPFTCHAVVAGDLDEDGRDDLVLMHRYALNPPTHAPVRFFNQSASGAASTFSLAAFLRWDLGVPTNPGPEQQAWPVLAPFARDGDLDLALYVETEGDLVIGYNGYTDHNDHLLSLTINYGKWAWGGFTPFLEVQRPTPTAQLANATSLHIQQWDADIDAAGTGVILTDAVETTVLSLPLMPKPFLQLPSYDAVGPKVRYLRLYFVREEGGQVVDVGPATTLAVTFNESIEPDLIAIGIGGQGIVVYEYKGHPGQPMNYWGPGGSQQGGGTTEPPRPPTVDDGGGSGQGDPP